MKTTIKLVFATLATATIGVALAQDEHSAHHPQGDQPAAKEESADAEVGGMERRMERMPKLMAEIHSAKDPVQHQKLMHEHMEAMQETMRMMRGMRGAGEGAKRRADMQQDDAAGGSTGQEHSHGDQASAEGAKGGMEGHMMMGMRDKMMKKQKMTERRMEMMEMMMEQMLEHEAAEQSLEGR